METYDIYGNYLQEMSLLSESDLDYGYWHKYWRLFFFVSPVLFAVVFIQQIQILVNTLQTTNPY